MKKLMNEQKVLKKLNIPSFRHLSKDKIINMASLLDQMDPEVAIKALEQFPEFASTTKQILSDFKESLNNALTNNKESVQSYYDSCNSIIDSLQKELENETLSFDEKKYIIEKMLQVSESMGLKDSENKKFLATCLTIGGFLGAGAIAVLASTLGSNTRVETTEFDDDDIIS